MDTLPWEGAPYAPREWQEKALPELIKEIKAGKRPIVSAIMGSGKSILIAELVFVALQKLKPDRVVVVTAPRQALVVQLSKTISRRCGAENVGCFYTYEKEVNKKVIVCCNASAQNLSVALEDRKIAMLVGDEIHGTESAQFKKAYELLSPACAVGFTATPFRSNEQERLTLWDTVAYKYTAGDALKDKVIVPWERASWHGDQFEAEQVDEICHYLIEQSGKGPGIVSALDIEDAENFAQFMHRQGFNVKAIHSRIPKHMRDSMIRKLERGELDMLVHVNLLSEGVDMPWLKWLCLRRPVGARVRFVQEVGRVLRSHPGKEYAVIMDPHDLFSKHGLVYPEALGELLKMDPDEEELASLELDEEQADKVRKMPPATAVGKLEAWMTELLSIMTASSICKPKQDDTWSYEWRCNGASVKQIRTVEKMFWSTRYLPLSIRADFKLIIQPENIGKLTAGTVSDILDILFGLADASADSRKIHRHWNFPPLRLPTLDMPVQGYLFAANKK